MEYVFMGTNVFIHMMSLINLTQILIKTKSLKVPKMILEN